MMLFTTTTTSASTYFRLFTITAHICIWSALSFDTPELEIVCDQDPDAPVGMRMCYVAGVERSSRTKAKTFCEEGSFGGQKGWTLASIHTAAQNDLVHLLRGTRERNVWIGLTDTEKEGHFVWDDGTPYDFSLWDPSDTSTSKRKDFMYMNGDGVWDDIRKNSEQLYPVCGRRVVVDHCAEGTHNCDEVCISTDDEFTCSCHSSHYRLHEDGHSCVDVNECDDEDAHECNHKCNNVEGGDYTCSCNSDHYRLDSDGHTCVVDVNECDDEDAHECNHKCNNVEGGGYTCSCNSDHYRLDSDGHTCVDVNECDDEDAHECNHKCNNVEGGGYTCSCNSEHYRLDSDGHTCVDVNECDDEEAHECNHKCNNVEGGDYTCSCNSEHYRLDSDGHTCVDVNECVEGTHNCAHKCNNVEGGRFTCSCRNNYWLDRDGARCHDVNECTAGGRSVCGASKRCKNTGGSHQCIPCGNGYKADATGTKCVDIDECEDGVDTCGSFKLCRNTEGSHTCKRCGPGMTIRIRDGGKRCELTLVGLGPLSEAENDSTSSLSSEVTIGSSVAVGLLALVAVAILVKRRASFARSPAPHDHPCSGGRGDSRTESNIDIRASLHQEGLCSSSNRSGWGGGVEKHLSRSEWMVDNPLAAPLPPV